MGQESDCKHLAASFEAGLRAVEKQTKATPGRQDHDGCAGARGAGDCGRGGLRRAIATHHGTAAGAARAGAEATKDMIAKYGRAKFLGEKTRGSADAGATSIALLFEGFSAALCRTQGGWKWPIRMTCRMAKNYHLDVPQTCPAFSAEGQQLARLGHEEPPGAHLLSRRCRTVMLAVDHGYFQGPTTGLERIDISIAPLVPYADALMITRGALRSSIPPEMSKPVVLRSSGGQSILKELSNELVAVDIEDAVRLNASALAVQVYIGGVHEHESIGNLVEIVDAGNRHGIPTMAVTGVGKELVRDAKYLGLATRMCAEMGAHFVKTYYCEKDFARVAAGCPVPLVIAGGKKLPELEALDDGVRAMNEGAAGVDMGRNIFQCEAPKAMIQAVRAVVHGEETPEKALDLYHSLKSMEERSQYAK